jgi:pimeloyl-ACP methyl ester carboxylesterase
MPAFSSHRAASLRLADGRRLRLVETGPRDGFPVLYCHGAIGTPVGRSVDLEELAARLHLRYIAVNRPGIGGSDHAPGRTVISFAADIEQLADALGLQRFSVVGVSAGGPYALAIGSALRDRVRNVAVCSSLSPLSAPHRTPGMGWRIRLGLSMLAVAPGACTALGDAILPVIRRHPELLHRVIAAHAAPEERERLELPGEREAASSSFLDATAYGVRGMIEDYVTYSGPWGFPTASVTPPVHVWHGAKDPLVPVEHALQLAAGLPQCRLFVAADEGHHFFRRPLGDILDTLLRPEAPRLTVLEGAAALRTPRTKAA